MLKNSFGTKLSGFSMTLILVLLVLSSNSCSQVAINGDQVASDGDQVASARAITNQVPDYEVKLYMTPSVVLDSSNELKSSVRSYFAMPSSKTKMAMQFLETSAKTSDAQGWLVRVRKMEGMSDSEFEVTFKKRYAITNGNIDGALTTAASEGFPASETSYAAQVEWGYTKQTLSLSNVKSVSHSGYNGMDLMSLKDSVSESKSHIAGKFANWVYNGWGTDQLNADRLYGPVSGKRWIGTWKNNTIYIEVWAIKAASGSGYEYVVEASFKTTSRTTASANQIALKAELRAMGWLTETDILKTQMILDRY